MKIVRAIRQGRILPNKPKTASTQPQFYPIWNDEPSNAPAPLPAPKPRLPGHAESYNPPEEYLPTKEEREQWEATDPEDRERDFLPQKHSALRLVPAYDQFIKERFNRQLDLYLAPRVQRVKLQIDPESLIPKLPSPSSLRPFPVYKSLQVPHDGVRTRAISVSPDGAWVVSGDESGVVRLFEVIVGKEVKRWTFKGKVGCVEWCPRTDVSYFVPISASSFTLRRRRNAEPSDQKVVLDNVSGRVVPGELLAILGPSGAGKTTLIEILARKHKSGQTTGGVAFPGAGSDGPRIGFVPQQDVLPPMLTVREALLFSAKLRQPPEVPDSEKEAYVETVLKMCGLEDFADAIVGSQGVEHKKRTTIGVELAAKVRQFLDLHQESYADLC